MRLSDTQLASILRANPDLRAENIPQPGASAAPFTLHLPGHRAESWNVQWAGRHWAERSRHKHAVAALVRAHLDLDQTRLFDVPVSVAVIATYARAPVDCDNVCVKAYLDALIGIVIADDSPDHITQVSVTSRRGDADSLTIHLRPTPP